MDEDIIRTTQDMKELNGMVYDKYVDRVSRKNLKELQKKGLVELAWVLTEKGKRE